MEKSAKYLHILKEEIHSTVFATIDNEGHPATCAIDIMLADEYSLYFLTAKGKAFYQRLTNHPVISLTGMKGKDTMSSKSVTIRGKVRELGKDLLPAIFSENPYMAEIYPDDQSRSSLTVFQIYEGEGEFFDLSAKPIFREKFSFGGVVTPDDRYIITEMCDGCGLCQEGCPQKCIDTSQIPVKIEEEHCLQCGRCLEICPHHAILNKVS